MATKKVKRYDEGGKITEGENVNIDDETRARARKFVADNEDTAKPKSSTVKPSEPKPKVVTKEELAKSGMSLRDYLNKQQGLTRRDGARPSSQGGSGRGTSGGPTADELDSYASSKKAARQSEYDKANAAAATPAGKAARAKKIEEQALEESHPEDLVLGIAKAPAKAALSAGRALATKGADEAIYLGKTAARRIEPEAARLASAAGKRISGSDAKKIANNPTRKISGPEVAAEGRESVTNPMSWMSGPKNARDFKKGGKIKPAAFANGGSVSRRGDGIASKGKTRGRMC